MNFKLDENLGLHAAQILRDAGHDVLTVRDQQLNGVADDMLYEVCCREQRCLATLDLDFGNVLRFPPEPTAGIAILRPPGRATLTAIAAVMRVLVEALERERVTGRLWIIEPGRIRVHQSSDSDE